MAEQLTAAQRAAVENRGGPLLVSAAAGSGKTKVLIDRLMGYLKDPADPANLDDFLVITYTKAAASELRAKIGAKLAQEIAAAPENRHLRHQTERLYLAKISTVHAFCAQLLRSYAFQRNLPADARVADEAECSVLRQRAMERVLEAAYGNLEAEPAVRAFLDTQGFGRDDRVVPEIVASLYDASQCHLDPENWLEDCARQARFDGQDPGDTVWGQYLLQQYRRELEDCAAQLERLLAVCGRWADLDQKYAPQIRRELENIRACQAHTTWREMREHPVSFGRLSPLRSPQSPDDAACVKVVRASCKERLTRQQEVFQLDAGQAVADLQQSAQAVEGLVRLTKLFAAAFRAEKEKRRVLDFSDLEHETLGLLYQRGSTEITSAAREIGRQFREVLVDEYQDTNAVQDSIFAALTRERGNCFLVGDVKQSIYRFRLADPGIFLEKYRQFVPAAQAQAGQGRKILLSENFRSGGEILEAANWVFGCCMYPEVGGLRYGPEESLREGVAHEALPTCAVELHGIQLEQDAQGRTAEKYPVEAQFVARRIRELLDEPAMVRGSQGLRPVRPGDIAILLRSPGTCGAYYAAALARLQIPAVTGAAGSLLDDAEIQVLWALLRVVDNPLQDIPLESVLASPLFCFSADRLGRVRANWRQGSLFEALTHSQEAGEFLALLEELRRTARQEPVGRLMEEIYRRTHIEAVFGAMEDGAIRQRNLERFYEMAVSFEQSGKQDLSQFLEFLDRAQERGLMPEESGVTDAVQILSIHKSKGLEYPVVFLSNLSAAFNREDLRANVLVDPVLGIGCSALDRASRCRYPTVAKRAIARRMDQENVSEELRVLYVAMTRAKDRLIMTDASRYLTGTLTSLAQRSALPGSPALSRQADSLGYWVLLAAMLRTEAGAFFQAAGKPAETQVQAHPWHIQLHHLGPVEQASAAEQAPPPAEEIPQPESFQQALSLAYPWQAATRAPSKVTATQLKGRTLDEEVADGTARRSGRFRRPEFLEQRAPQGREIGVATHQAMQFLRYEACTSPEAVEQELQRLCREEYLTQRQLELANRQWIWRFFQQELGRRLQSGQNVLREFKFSLLEDGGRLDPQLTGEQILLQGVVDCCLIEPEGLTILDFKTDRVQPGREAEAAERYAPQVRAYGRALARIYRLPVCKLLLYFFQTGNWQEIAP